MRAALLGTILACVFLFACGKDRGEIFPAAAAFRDAVLITISGDTNHRGITMYDMEGNFIKSIAHLRTGWGYPRGIANFDSDSFLVLTETPDQWVRVFYDGTLSLFSGSSNYSGTVFGGEEGPNGYFYAYESNRVEKFDSSGNQVGNNFINGSVGGCTISTPRGMAISHDGYLLVSNQAGADEILSIDVSTDTPSCVSAVAFGNNPYGMVAHSDGNLYVVTQGDDAVYVADPDGSNASIIYQPGIAELRDPTAIVEMPNGDLLVSSATTDTIERITTTGMRVGTEPFIQDNHSLNVLEMIIVPAETR